VTPGEVRSFLSIAVVAPSQGLVVIVSEPLDLNVPISNRFISQRSILRDISTQIGQHIQLINLGRSVQSNNSALRVELPGLHGSAAATVLVTMPTLDAALVSFQSTIDALVETLLAVLAVLAAVALAGMIRRTRSPWLRIVLLIVLVWAVRVVFLFLSAPGRYVGGPLFDPTIYGSPFAYGLVSSLGQTLLSVFAFCLSVCIVFWELSKGDGEPTGSRSKGARTAGLFLVPVVCGALLAVLRAYGASIRSFVYDSTLQYVNPSQLIPDVGVIVMYGIIILLTMSLLLLALMLFRWMARQIVPLFRSTSLGLSSVVIAVVFSIATVIFFSLNNTPQFPDFIPFLLLFMSIGLLLWVGVNGRMRVLVNSLTGVFVLLVFSFLLSVPVLDQAVHSKERDRLRVLADELIRPVEPWLSFVVGESFRSLSTELEGMEPGDITANGSDSQIAFPLWSRTLLSREGYNSALFLYDPTGQEVSRFAVGLTSYEQTELLTRLFDVNEETLNVVERRVPQGVIKYYGMWGTLRDEDGNPRAIAAILLSASERALFRGEAPELLRTLGSASASWQFRSMVISEYQNGLLVASNDDDQYAGMPVEPQAKAFFAASPNRYFEMNESKEGKNYELLFVRDESMPGRLISIRLENVGLRWHLFNIVKIALVYGVALFLITCLFISFQWKEYRHLLFGFRGRLITAFLAIALIPLVVIAYYNRQFAEERQQVNLSKQLGDDLDLLHHRILNSVTSEEDFRNGVNNDFCETVATDYGIDFSVFRRTQVQASSRPELYQAGLLDSRLPGAVFARILVAGKAYVQTAETIGDVSYAVGYRPIVQNGSTLGILSVPTLSRQQDLEAELAERNAFTLGVYSILLILTIAVGVTTANQLSQPIRDLTKAAADVGEGRLDVRIRQKGSGEIGELIGTFNAMVGELEKSREELSRAEREKAWKEMAKQVAHEIKNPLTPMKLSVQHLRQAFKDKASDLESIVLAVTQTMSEQIDTLARIATEFSQFARMPERRFERVELRSLLDETLRLFGEVKGIEFRTKFSDTGAALIADREELRRVFINIVRNSIQAMEAGGTITIETSESGGRWIVSIKDTGAGIPSELLSKVFEPNFSTKTEGMGLGLAIARKVIEDLNGTIEVKSAVGKGTVIKVTLPLSGPNASA